MMLDTSPLGHGPRSPLGVSSRPALSVVVAVYNEERNIEPFLARLVPVLERIGSYEILFCLDPCSDRTEEVITRAIDRNPHIHLVVFSRRFGQPAAVSAGLRLCRGESCVVIDVDLQDPPELILPLYEKHSEGYDVVLARRRSRVGETVFKKAISAVGYRLINAVSDVKIPRDTGDFRIMSRRVIDSLAELKEGHGFLRGLVAFVGYKQTFIEYDRDPRAAGDGKYNRYWGSLRIGLNGLVGFSNFLLSLTLLFGLVVCALGSLLAVYVAAAKLVWHQPFPMGVPMMIILALFLGGVQIISIGVLGQYIGRIYDEVRERPQFLIERIVSTNPAPLRGGHEAVPASTVLR